MGPARDADVFATEIWPPLRRALHNNPLLRKLDAHWSTQQQVAAATARRALTTRRYQRLMRDLDLCQAADSWRGEVSAQQLRLLDGLARNFAHKVIKRRNARVHHSGRAIGELSEVQLHALRIRVKKLRYAVAGFGLLFKHTAVSAFLGRLSRLQDVLGKINDIHVAEQHVAMALARQRGDAACELRAALAAWRESRTTILRHALRVAWRKYRHAKKFW